MISDTGRKRLFTFSLFVAVVVMAFVCLFVGSSHMSIGDCLRALARNSVSL